MRSLIPPVRAAAGAITAAIRLAGGFGHAPATRPWRRIALTVLLAPVLLVTAETPRQALAQPDFFFFLRPPAPVQPQRPQRQNRQGGWWPGSLFGAPPPPQYLEQAPPQQQQQQRKQPPPEPEGVTYSSADAAIQGKRTPPSQFVLVLGDRLASQLAQGLADITVPDRARIAVIDSAVEESGFLPTPVDWMAKAPDAITAGRPSVTVLALGSDDLQPIKDGDVFVEPLTERWSELYAKRVDDLLNALRGKAGRIILVGLAPVQSTKLSDDYARLNEILKARAARAGVSFVQVWDGFVDEDGKYLVSGPAVDGQRRRLRNADGIRFTRAGGRKLAFFVQKELNRLLADPAKPLAATPESGTRASALAGGPAGGRGSEAPTNASAPTGASARVLVGGAPLNPVRGRTDDFSWPPPSEAPPAAQPAPSR